jgi:pimeloyl-ACP methyl ester carboxylesterase
VLSQSALLILSCVLTLSCTENADSPPQDRTDVAHSVTSGYAEINSVELYYEIIGGGEPLLLMHGGLGGSEHFAAMIPGLAEHFQVITVDRRGHGRSPDSEEEYSYSAMAAEMAAFLDYLEIPSARMIGFSDGGVVGYHLAGSFPEKVEKLVAVGANYRVGGMTEESISFMRDRLTVEGLRELYPTVEESYNANNPQPENYPEFIRKSRAMWLRDPYVEDDIMKAIEAPVLVLLGDKDAIRIEHALETRTLVRDSHICVIPDASHFVLTEKPQLMLQIVADFFADDSDPDSRSSS